MDYRQLGGSGIRVSTIALGTMGFGGTGWAETIGKTDVRGAARQIEQALDAGVNLIDTADVYSSGLSEEILGAALGSRRDDALIATKVRFPMGAGPNDAGLSRHHIIRSCEASLRRLQADHIDLYQVHGWDGQTDLEETLSTLDDLVRAGKVRYIGASNHSGWHLLKALGVSERRGFERYVTQQIYYSLHARDAEAELIPAAIDQQLGVLAWSPLSGGLLTGRFRRDRAHPEGSRQTLNWGSPPVHDEERFYDLIEVLVRVAEERGHTPAQVALAWVLGRPAISSVVVGARTGDQLAETLAAADVTLDAEAVAALDRASATPLLYPYWHQAEIAGDRLGKADLSLLGEHITTPDSEGSMTGTRPVAVVTGASSGIGRELCRVLAREGYDLALVARRETALRELAAQLLVEHQSRCTVIAADLSRPDGVAQVYDEVTMAGLEPEVLVNNAGFGVLGSFVDTEAEAEERRSR